MRRRVQGGRKLRERATSRWVTKPTTRSPSSTGRRARWWRHMTATASSSETSTSSATTSAGAGELRQADLVRVPSLGDDLGHDVTVAHHPGQAAVALAERHGVLGLAARKRGRIGRRLGGAQDLDVRVHDVPDGPHRDLPPRPCTGPPQLSPTLALSAEPTRSRPSRRGAALSRRR